MDSGRQVRGERMRGMGIPRFLLVFRGKRSLRAAGTRAKQSGAMELWVVLAVVVALIAVVVLVCVRTVNAL